MAGLRSETGRDRPHARRAGAGYPPATPSGTREDVEKVLILNSYYSADLLFCCASGCRSVSPHA